MIKIRANECLLEKFLRVELIYIRALLSTVKLSEAYLIFGSDGFDELGSPRCFFPKEKENFVWLWFMESVFFFKHSIKFEFSLAAYALGGNSNLIFNAAFDLMIFGRRFYLATDFNLRDAIGSLKRGADKATEWYKEKMNKKGATDTEENYYDNANPYADFDMSGTYVYLLPRENYHFLL